HDAARRIREQVARMRVDGRSELVAHDEAVEVEVDAALREGAGGIVERILPFDFHLLDAAAVGTAREGAGTLRGRVAAFDRCSVLRGLIELHAGAAGGQYGRRQRDEGESDRRFHSAPRYVRSFVRFRGEGSVSAGTGPRWVRGCRRPPT